MKHIFYIMKRFLKNLVAAALLMAAAVPAMGEGLGGDWAGSLQVAPQMALKLVFHVSEPGVEPATVTMDSPDQGAFGIPAEVGHLSGDSISVAIPMIKMTYDGTLKEGKIEGTFRQNGMELPLTVEPQTPAEEQQPEHSLRFPATSKDLKIFKKKPTDISFG